MRFDRDITLVTVAQTKQANGSYKRSETARTTFCNMMNVGAKAYYSARESGLRADAEVQLRTSEYDGEECARMGGVEYEVERAVDTGEFTRLTLAKKAVNA